MGCGDGEEFGDWGEVGDVVEGLGRAFKKVSQSGIEEQVFHCEVFFVRFVCGVGWEECKSVVCAGVAFDIVDRLGVVEDGNDVNGDV